MGQLILDTIMKQAESQNIKKPLYYPSLIFGLIKSQVNVLQDTDVFELDSPFVVITDKLKNTIYHVK